MTAPRGLVFWRGPSMIDRAPVVVIATGIGRKSENPKTGPMVQVWILREDVSPISAINSGADRSICGDCVLRGIIARAGRRDVNRLRSCYVQVRNAPQRIWKAYRAGAYVDYNARQHARYLRGRLIRFGAYGDPAAAPATLWRRLARLSGGWTGYTHAWRRFPSLRPLCMASVETDHEAQEAHLLGWRTFRSLLPGAALSASEISCPAAAESTARRQDGGRWTCADCLACNGRRSDSDGRVSIAIVAHGSAATRSSYRKTAIGTAATVPDGAGRLPLTASHTS